MTAFPTYSTGTVAVANGATAITGTGSNWTGANAKPGDTLVVAGHQVIVQDVTDSTHLVIDAWPFTSVSAGTAYVLYKTSPLRFVGGDAMASVSTLVADLNAAGYFVFVDPADSAPDPSLGEDGQYAFQSTTRKYWLKTGGVWVFQGQPGIGDLVAANNLSDVANTATAFNTLAPTTTRGDIIFRNATTNTRLASSTSGFALIAGGAGADPAWAGFLPSGTGAVTRTWQDKAGDLKTVKDFNAKGDTIAVTATVSITSGAAALTATGATFTATDVGKSIFVPGAGAAGAVLSTTISAFTDATHVTLGANAGTTVSAVSKVVTYGTDDTAEIQAAVTASRFVYEPPGRYLISGTITLPANTTLIGAGPYASVLTRGGTDQSYLVLGTQCVVEKIGMLPVGAAVNVAPSTVPTSGIGIEISSASSCVIRDIWMEYLFNGIRTTNVAGGFASGLNLHQMYACALKCDDNSLDVHVSGFIFFGNSSSGDALVKISDACEAVCLTDGDIIQGLYSLLTAASSYTARLHPAFCKFTGVYFDSSTNGVSVDKADGFTFTGCWFSNSTNNGVNVVQADDTRFIGCDIVHNLGHGAAIGSTNAKRTIFSGCNISANNVGNAGADGIVVVAGVTNFVVSGCVLTNNYGTIANGHQRWGINISAGASDNYVISGNDLTGNVTGGLTDGGSGTNKIISGCLGAKTANQGSGSIAIGSSSVTVNHGLAFTPAQADIFLSSIVQKAGAGIVDAWVSATTPTTFTVTTNANVAGGTFFFGWSARVKSA